MKKTTLLLALTTVALHTAAQYDTLPNHFPAYYYYNYMPSHHYNLYLHGHQYEHGWRCPIHINTATDSYIEDCSKKVYTPQYHLLDPTAHNIPDFPDVHPHKFAVEVANDTILNVCGAAIIVEKALIDTFAANGYNMVTIQLLDTNMNRITEKNFNLTNTSPRKQYYMSNFVLNNNNTYRMIYRNGIFFNLYEATFTHPTEISDRFFLATFISRNKQDSVALPFLEECEIHIPDDYYGYSCEDYIMPP